MKKLFSLLLALMIVMSLAVPASAASFTILGEDKFTFSPGSEYHETDLFGDGFKNIMPGDTIRQSITIRGEFANFSEDSIKVTLQGIPHGANNPLKYSESFEFTDGKDQAEIPGQRDETIETMEDFLSVLNLKVTNRKTGAVIFNDSADEILDPVVLGKFRNKGSVILDLELKWVPTDNDNLYANRVGEIDWQFTLEAYDDPDVDNPKTGDYIMMAVAVMAVSAAALIIILAVKRKKKK